MIEQAGGPVNGIMAQGAIHRLRPLLELAGMDILVTPDAAFGRRLKRNNSRTHSGSNRPMTIHAGQHLVPAHQGKRGVPVIE